MMREAIVDETVRQWWGEMLSKVFLGVSRPTLFCRRRASR